jgi:hypothetical protein
VLVWQAVQPLEGAVRFIPDVSEHDGAAGSAAAPPSAAVAVVPVDGTVGDDGSAASVASARSATSQDVGFIGIGTAL